MPSQLLVTIWTLSCQPTASYACSQTPGFGATGNVVLMPGGLKMLHLGLAPKALAFGFMLTLPPVGSDLKCNAQFTGSFPSKDNGPFPRGRGQ